MSSDSGGIPGFRGGDRNGCLPQWHSFSGPCLSTMRQQSGHRVSRFLRSGPYYRRRHRLFPSLPYQSGQCGYADSRQSRRHHIVGSPLMDRHHTLWMHRQAGLGGTSRHSLLRSRDAALGMDCQEKQIY